MKNVKLYRVTLFFRLVFLNGCSEDHDKETKATRIAKIKYID